jgi:formylglycine-generating enzyme required for sulfatase activity
VTAPANVTALKTGLTASVVAQAAGSTYNWGLSSGSITAGQGTTSITWTAPASGSVTVTCTVTNAAGDAAAPGTATSTVVAMPAITSFTAAAPVITNGTGTTLSYTFTGGTGTIDQSVPGPITSSGTSNVSPTATTVYTLTVDNGAGGIATQQVTITVVPIPTITADSFTNSGPVAIGATATLTATFDAGPGGTAVVTGGASPLTMTSGTPLTTGTLSANTTFTLTVSNAATTPATVTATTTVLVGDSLTVTIQGLGTAPSTVLPANVTVTGPNGFNQTLTATQTLSGLADGAYTITAATVTDPNHPGLGGALGPAHLQRYPAVLTQTASLSFPGTRTGAVTVNYPPATLTVAAGTTTIDLVLVPPGSFIMGETDVDVNYPTGVVNPEPNANPHHTVTLGKAFYVAKTLCTQAQWLALMGSNPSAFQLDDVSGSGDHLTRPVDTVAFNDIATSTTTPAYTCFIDALNLAASSSLSSQLGGGTFRLPSEAEYEYACRAGSTGDSNYFFGTQDPGNPAGEAVIDTYGWFVDNGASASAAYPSGSTHPVGQKLPNAWGLYDMIGNLWEACQDSYHPAYDTTGTGIPTRPDDGTAWVDGPTANNFQRSYRGGAWEHPSHYGQSKSRGPYPINSTDGPNWDEGFRVILQLP